MDNMNKENDFLNKEILDKNTEIKPLKKSHIVRNLTIIFLITLIGSAIYFKTSSAKYQTTQIISIIDTKVVNKPWWTLNVHKGEETKTIKSSGIIEGNEYEFDYQIEDGYVITNYTCTRRDKTEANSDITLKIEESNKLKITDSAKKRGTVCEVYIGLLKDKILADNKLQEGEPDFSKTTCNNEIAIANTSNTNQVKCADETQNGVYKSEDDYGTTYYYRGSVNNNWVKFGKNSEGQDIWWRIIRINGNGTIRLIYAGIGKAEDVDPNYKNDTLKGYYMKGFGINYGNDAFNDLFGYNSYAGYMYTTGLTNGNENSSNAKTIIDQWYNVNLSEESHLIDGATGFCGDRKIIETGTNFGAYGRLVLNKQPSYICPDKINDLYTTPLDTNNGNKKLQYPVGMITADEVAYAGGAWIENNYGYWLTTDESYWTISPFDFTNGWPSVFIVGFNGMLGYGVVGVTNGLRPVINLKADTQITSGDGTIDEPYIVKTDI